MLACNSKFATTTKGGPAACGGSCERKKAGPGLALGGIKPFIIDLFIDFFTNFFIDMTYIVKKKKRKRLFFEFLFECAAAFVVGGRLIGLKLGKVRGDILGVGELGGAK